MTESSPSQSQPSYPSNTPLSFKYNQNKPISEDNLAIRMAKLEGKEFQQCLRQLSELLKNGQANSFIKHTGIMRKIMNHFTQLSKALYEQSHDLSVEYRMIYALSVLAQLIRENPKVYFPFTRKFLNNLFLIDEECLYNSPKRRDILAIISVLYENLSRQMNLLQKYDMVNTLKRAILSSYSLIDQAFTLKVYNKVIMNLVQKGVIFTTAEFEQYHILDTVSNFIQKSHVEEFLLKVKMAILCIQKVNPSISAFQGCTVEK